MKSFIVLTKFELHNTDTDIYLKYLKGKLYKEDELFTGWRQEKDELGFLQGLGYLIVVQDIYAVVKTLLLRKVS